MLPHMGEEEGWDHLYSFERDLGKLLGIRAARLVHERGRITEIHVVSDGSKQPKQLIRDIETLGQALHQLEVDRKTVSISEFPDEIAPSQMSISVLEVGPVAVSTDAGVATCTVDVRRGEEVSTATDTGPATEAGLYKLIARTTVRAASDLLNSPLAADVENAFFLPDSTVATVVLQFADLDGNAVVAPGTAVSRGDKYRTIAVATLDAIKRHDRV